jgi:hypothetical protein
MLLTAFSRSTSFCLRRFRSTTRKNSIATSTDRKASRVTKRDFFSIFKPAWDATMTQDNILKSFQATGVWPMDADVILQRFNNRISEQDKDSKLGQHGDGDSWRELRKIFDAAVADKAKVEAQRLEASLRSLQTKNELLHHENDGLTRALEAKKKHKTKSKTMDLQQRKEYHGGTVFWSPRKLREARARRCKTGRS